MPRKKAPLPEPQSATVVPRLWGMTGDLTPSAVKSALASAEGGCVAEQSLLFDRMLEVDGHLRGLVDVRKRAVTGLEWDVVPDDTGNPDQAQAAKAMLENVPGFATVMRELLSFAYYGFAVAEIVWESTPTGLNVKQIIPVQHRYFTFQNQDSMRLPHSVPRLLTRDDSFYGIELEKDRFIYSHHRQRDQLHH